MMTVLSFPVSRLVIHVHVYIWLGGGGGGNLRVILVRVCGSVFWNLPQAYTWSSKKMTYSYTWLNKMFTYSYTVLWFLHTPFAVYKYSLQMNIWVSELNIWAKILVLSYRVVRKWDNSYNNDEKLEQSYTFSSYNNDEKLEQSYTFSKKKGACRLHGGAEKGGYSRRTSVLCHI